MSFSDIAAQFSEQLNKHVIATYVPLHHYLNDLKPFNAPQEDIEMTRFLFADLLDGRNEYTTDAVMQVLGRQARPFSAFIQNAKQSGVWA